MAHQFLAECNEPNFTMLHSAYCMSRPSVVCLKHCCTIGRDLNFLAIFLHRLTAQGLGQFVPKFWTKIQTGSRGLYKLNIIQDTAIVTIEDK